MSYRALVAKAWAADQSKGLGGRARQIFEIRLIIAIGMGRSKKYSSNITKSGLQRTKYLTLSTTPLYIVHSACTITSTNTNTITTSGISACGSYIDTIIKIRILSLIFCRLIQSTDHHQQ